MYSETCPRQRDDCTPANNIISDEVNNDGKPCSFICSGWNNPETRTVAQDRFTLCWKTATIDTRDHMDARDILDTIAVLTNTLSVDENVRVGEGLTHEDMITKEFLF